MKKHLRGKRYLRSRATVQKGREKRFAKTLKRYALAMDNFSAACQKAKNKVDAMLYTSLKDFMLRQRAKEEREILYGTGEGEPVGFLKM